MNLAPTGKLENIPEVKVQVLVSCKSHGAQ